MSFVQTVSNWLLGEYKVRTTQVADESQIQHMRLDIGDGATESTVSGTNPLPVSFDTPVEVTFEAAESESTFYWLNRILEFIRSPSFSVPTASGTKILAQTSTDSTMGAVTSCATVTNLTNFNTIDSRQAIWSLWGTEYNTGIRNRIT